MQVTFSSNHRSSAGHESRSDSVGQGLLSWLKKIQRNKSFFLEATWFGFRIPDFCLIVV